MRPEQKIESDYVAWVRHGLRGYAFKLDAAAGLPDRIVLLPGGVVFFVEFKTPKGVVEPLQVEVHETLQRWGHTVYVWRSLKQARDATEAHIRSARRGS